MLENEEIENQKVLLTTHRETLAILLQQRAMFGTVYAPPAILHGINQSRSEIKRIKEVLRFYGCDVENRSNDSEDKDLPSLFHAPETERERRNRVVMLKKVHHYWVKGVLENSLHRAALINLGMEYNLDAVAYPWEMMVERLDSSSYALPQGTHIAKVFDDLHNELLILGMPGSGKTTMLLELARTLIARAEQDNFHPIPVVFHLSTWAEQCSPMDIWLIEELNARYDVPRKVGQAWIDHNQVLPLLDGLDEVRLSVRNACVESINSYRQEHGMVGVVVCSRIADYATLTAKLKLCGAVILQPLTNSQIDNYLEHAGDQLVAMRTLLHEDNEMRIFANTPLMLSIMTLAYQGMPFDDLPEHVSLDARRKHLFETYVQRMLKRRGGDSRYSLEQTRHWLSWLAGQMVECGQTVLYLEKMQPNWLSLEHRLYSLLAGLVSGISFGVILSLGGVLFFSLILGFDQGVIVGLIFGLIGGSVFTIFSGRESGRLENIKPAESLRWSLRQAVIRTRWRVPVMVFGFGLAGWLQAIMGGGVLGSLFGGLAGGLALGLGAGVILRFDKGLLAGLIVGLGCGIVNGLVGGPVGGIIGGLGVGLIVGLGIFLMASTVADEISIKNNPNEGIIRSARNGVIFGLIFGSVFGLGIGIIASLISNSVFGLASALGIFLSSGLVFGLLSGGTAVVQHSALRLGLAWKNYAPLKYVQFLDYATERILLRRVGGGYIFAHRMLLEYFANSEPKNQHKNGSDGAE